MLPNFTTLISDDSPQVLLIGKKSNLLDSIYTFFEEKGLSVVYSSEEDVSTLQPQLNLYKIIWLADRNNLETKKIELVKESLKATTAPLIIIFPLLTGIKNHETYRQWSKSSAKQKKIIEYLSASFVTAYFIFLENLLEQGILSELFNFFLEKADEGYVLQPQLKLPLLDEKTALKAMIEPLFRPGFHQSVLIRGQDIASEAISSKIQLAYNQNDNFTLQISRLPAISIPIIGFTIQEKIVQSDINEAMIWQLAHLPSIQPSKKNNLELQKPHLPSSASYEEQPKAVVTTPVLKVSEPIATENKPIVEEKPIISAETSNVQQFATETEVQEELQRIFINNRTEKKVQRVIHISDVEKKIVKKSKHKKILFWGGLGVVGSGIGIISLIIIFYVSTQLVTKNLTKTIYAVMNTDKKEVELEMLALTTSILAFQTDHYSAFIDNPTLAQAAELVDLSKNIQELNRNTMNISDTAVIAYKTIFNGGSNSSIELFSNLESKAQKAHELIAETQVQLDQISISTQNQENEIDAFKTKLQEEFKKTGVVQQLAPLLPDLSGLNNERTYAFILQNNQELRPTGGFIQSVALITVNQGSITATEFMSSYDLDAKMSGIATPPEEITQLLGEERWYLRDSNWDPDFSVSSEKINSFIENSTSKKIHGIFAIDIYGLEKILAVTGPVELPQYNEVITDKNISERLEFHSEVTFVDKENNPDYSTVLFSTIFSQLKTLEDEQIIRLYDSLQILFKENNLLVSMADQNELMSMKSLGWSGSLISPDCPATLGAVDCFVDTFAQVEANIGINKANYYLEKSINHIVTMNEASLAHKRTITYKNTAQTNTWPKGNYKAYIRLYVPKEATLQSIFYNTSPIPLEQVTIKDLGQKRVIGFTIDVPINSQSIVDVEYTEDFVKSLPYSYAFFEQKQPGTPVIPFTLTVVPPANAKPVLIAPEAQLHSQTVLFQEEQRSHVFYGIQFE